MQDDFPREMTLIAKSRTGLPNRYFYKASGGEFATELCKHDLKAGRTESYPVRAGRFAGEVVLVPRDDSKVEVEVEVEVEVDVYLLTEVCDSAAEKRERLIDDARAIEEKPLARVVLQARVPYGLHWSFHLIWITDKDL